MKLWWYEQNAIIALPSLVKERKSGDWGLTLSVSDEALDTQIICAFQSIKDKIALAIFSLLLHASQDKPSL